MSFKLPELGVTEFIGDLLGKPRDPVTGGSQLFPQNTSQVPSGASRDFGDTPDVPTNTPNITAPSGGGTPAAPAPKDFDRFDRNANPGEGWFFDAADGWKRSGGGGGNSSLLAEIEKIYSPGIQNLANLERNAQEQYGSAVDSTEKAYQQALEHSRQGYEQNLTAINDNQTELSQSKKSALEDAIRAYNALDQARQARFGAGSSAGQAVGELARTEFFRQQGGIETQFVNQVRDLTRQKSALSLQQKQYEDQNELQKNEALSALKSELNQKLSQIQASRGELESAKAAARLNVVQDAMNRAQSIQLAFNERAASIREAVATKQAELDGNYGRLLQLAEAYDSGQFFDPYAENQYAGYDLSTGNAAQSSRYTFNPNANQEDEDNPFYEVSPSYGVSRGF